MRRWPWQDEYGDVSPGWMLGLVVGAIMGVSLLVQLVNDMHMNGYGLFGR